MIARQQPSTFFESNGYADVHRNTVDRCKQEVHDQTLIGKKADSAVFGVSVARAVRALALERTIF